MNSMENSQAIFAHNTKLSPPTSYTDNVDSLTDSTVVKATGGRVEMRKNTVTGRSIRVFWLTATHQTVRQCQGQHQHSSWRNGRDGGGYGECDIGVLVSMEPLGSPVKNSLNNSEKVYYYVSIKSFVELYYESAHPTRQVCHFPSSAVVVSLFI